MAGEAEAEALAGEAERWITGHLGPQYAWPGNVRELEQCLRNVLVRGEYRPRGPVGPPAPEDLLASIRTGPVTADELVRRYVAAVFRETGSYLETARRLGLDRRTVKARLGVEGAGEAADRENPAEKT